MKIDSSTPLSPTLNRSADRAASSESANAELSPRVDNVTINPLAAKLSQLEQGNKPAFDANRVEELKKAISEGRFTVRADAIAGKIIESAQELLGK